MHRANCALSHKRILTLILIAGISSRFSPSQEQGWLKGEDKALHHVYLLFLCLTSKGVVH